MASEIQIQTTAANRGTLKLVIRNAAGAVWNGSGFVSYATANIDTYGIAGTEQGTASAYYHWTMPAGINTAGVYRLVAYKQAGGSLVETDTIAGTGEIVWSGSGEVGLDGVNTAIGGISTTVGSIDTTVGSISTTVGSIDTTVGSISTTVGTINTTVGGISTTVDGISTTVGGISTTVGGIDTTLGTVSTTVGTVSTTVGTINTNTSALGDLDATVTALDEAAASLETTVGGLDTQLTQIKAKTDLIGTTTVTVVSPVSETGNITLVRGDDYSATDSRQIAFSSTGWLSLVGATVTLRAVSRATGGTFTATGTVTGAGEATQTVYFQFTNTVTAALEVGDDQYSFDVAATKSSRVVTLVTGTITVQADA